jgi:hypothetical protein
MKIPKSKKKSFSSFDLASAYKQLGIKTLIHWNLPNIAIAPSEFFIKRLESLHRNFHQRSYEESKKFLIDAFCVEAMDISDKLKIWKGGKTESDILVGNADYLIAPRQDYLDTPFLCIVEAKRDYFECVLAQYLVEIVNPKAAGIRSQVQIPDFLCDYQNLSAITKKKSESQYRYD